MIVLNGILRYITNSCVGRIIRVYYKLLCWTEYYGLLKLVLFDGIIRFVTISLLDAILRCNTNDCVGRNTTVYYKCSFGRSTKIY